MNSWQRENPEERLRELVAERNYHLKALEHIESQIRELRASK
jgi:predicted Holliday junction resolvase-like endonuclease